MLESLIAVFVGTVHPICRVYLLVICERCLQHKCFLADFTSVLGTVCFVMIFKTSHRPENFQTLDICKTPSYDCCRDFEVHSHL